MSLPNEIVLYDIPSRGTPRCYSPNVWKARAALNFKKLPYRTEWLPYVDLVQTAEQIWKVPKNSPEESAFPYSYPTIKLPDDTFLMESLRIARKLEEIQPEPSLRLDTDHHIRALKIITQLQMALIPGVVYRVTEVLRPADAEFMLKERTRQMGAHPNDLAKNPDLNIKGPKAWQNAQQPIEALRELLKENENGPYVQGKDVSFADFVIVGGMRMFQRIDEDGDLYGRLVKEVGEGLIEKLEHSTEEWFRRYD